MAITGALKIGMGSLVSSRDEHEDTEEEGEIAEAGEDGSSNLSA